MASIGEQTAAAAGQMSASAREVSSHAQRMALTIQEQTQHIQMVHQVSGQMTEIAQKVPELIAQFGNFQGDRHANEGTLSPDILGRRKKPMFETVDERFVVQEKGQAAPVPAELESRRAA